MDLEILPEPSDDERRAIVEALRVEAAQGQTLTLWRLLALKAAALEDEASPPRRAVAEP